MLNYGSQVEPMLIVGNDARLVHYRLRTNSPPEPEWLGYIARCGEKQARGQSLIRRFRMHLECGPNVEVEVQVLRYI